MLRALTVKNFAVVSEQTLELGKGLNALTGETGAGKSILIEALGFLLGARGSSSWLRAGAERLEVAGTFDAEDFPCALRAQYKISEPTVAVRRELDAAGKTRATINAQPAPISALSALGDSLVDFHGQHEHQSLLRPAFQLDCLDGFGRLEKEAAVAAAAYEAWAALRAELESAQISDEERRRRVDTARYQLQELDEAKLRVGEEEEIEAALPLLKNAERLRGLAGSAYELLYEQEGSLLAGLLKAERALAELAKIDEAMRAARDRLESARVDLDELARMLGEYRGRVESSPEKVDALLARLEALSRLKKKYGPTTAELLAFRDKAAAELSRLENSELRAGELDKESASAQASLARACERLHEGRLKAARKLESAVLKELKPLGMPNARFSIAVEMEEGRFSQKGADMVEFQLAANPGEPLRPMKAVASGGELSRVMLALKSVLASADRVPILVFDEVDAGIGGSVARAVGERLAALGRGRQVLCVTHLPQVACFAADHFLVAKAVENKRSVVRVERLEGRRRLDALAVMLGGREVSAASRKHAQELLESSLK